MVAKKKEYETQNTLLLTCPLRCLRLDLWHFDKVSEVVEFVVEEEFPLDAVLGDDGDPATSSG